MTDARALLNPKAAARALNRQSDSRPTYLIRLRPERGVDPIRALRAILKSLLRRHGMRCTFLVEEERR
jgi:hypothetical protein